MRKYITALSAITFFSIAAFVYADTGCTPIYGGGQTCPTTENKNVTLNKTVQNPENGQFVDNLQTTNQPYTPGQTVIFRITVTNTSTKNMRTVQVKDVLPSQVTYTSGEGTYDAKTRTLTTKVENLNAKANKTIEIKAKVNNITTDQMQCVTNQATATSGGNRAQDNATFCVYTTVELTNQPTPVVPQQENQPYGQNGQPMTKGGQQLYPAVQTTEVPSTGPEAFALIGLLPTAAAGFYLRRKTS